MGRSLRYFVSYGKGQPMQYLFMALAGLAIVGLDQLTKYLTVTNLALGEQASFLPGFLGFTYVQNTGAAWSSFQGQIWLFALIFAVFGAFLVWELATGKMGFAPFEKWCLAVVFAGGLGNMIDRLRLGYVVDMIKTLFMEFPVFNVADCFICCGCFAMIFHLVFFNKEFWKDKK